MRELKRYDVYGQGGLNVEVPKLDGRYILASEAEAELKDGDERIGFLRSRIYHLGKLLKINNSALQAQDEEIARLRDALIRIAEWPYDIMGDCVAEATAEARAAMEAKHDSA